VSPRALARNLHLSYALWAMACIFTALGELDEAVTWLDRAIEQRDPTCQADPPVCFPASPRLCAVAGRRSILRLAADSSAGDRS
jgi:hypothetical protein